MIEKRTRIDDSNLVPSVLGAPRPGRHRGGLPGFQSETVEAVFNRMNGGGEVLRSRRVLGVAHAAGEVGVAEAVEADQGGLVIGNAWKSPAASDTGVDQQGFVLEGPAQAAGPTVSEGFDSLSAQTYQTIEPPTTQRPPRVSPTISGGFIGRSPQE